MSRDRGPLAWVLNLDAEIELAAPDATPSDQVRKKAAATRARLAETMPAGDVVLDRDPDDAARGLEARCWCPTPSALRRLAEAGARVPDAPPLEVLRRVNERGFAWAIATPPGGARCVTEAEAARALSRPGRWLAKRAFTFAGKGQRRVDGGALSDADRAWIRASLRQGAVYVETRVDVALELGLHGWLEPDGAVDRGALTVQDVDAAGQWRASRREAGELAPDERSVLTDTFERVVEALRVARYFGPFGVDAFRTAEGGFHPLTDLNGRYSMGWPVGMGGWR